LCHDHHPRRDHRLAPLYQAGEASADTRALLEAYLRDNPDFASTVREATERGATLLGSSAAAPSVDHEGATLRGDSTGAAMSWSR
jgi:hypothetical protein